MTAEAKSKFKRILKTASSAVWWCALILIFIMTVSIIGAKMRGRVPTVLGYSIMYVVSGSMEDEIPQGSYILIKTEKPEEVKINDVICFYSSDPAIYGIPNTHRVVEEPIVTDSGIEFVTRGDANVANDLVNARGDMLIGVYVKTLVALTALANAISGNTLAFVFVGLLIAIIGMTAYSVVLAKKSSKDEK